MNPHELWSPNFLVVKTVLESFCFYELKNEFLSSYQSSFVQLVLFSCLTISFGKGEYGWSVFEKDNKNGAKNQWVHIR